MGKPDELIRIARAGFKVRDEINGTVNGHLGEEE